jgi:hypothetical protein
VENSILDKDAAEIGSEKVIASFLKDNVFCVKFPQPIYSQV